MGNKAGSVWNLNLIDLYQPFDKSFTVNLGCNNSTWGGADGMVFALQPLNTSIGSSGGQMGMGGVSPSLGVYIDTYQNTIHGDPYNDHISINLNGDVIHSSSNNIAGPYDLGEVENCIAEPLRITWNPTSTIMQVFYNNILVLNYTGDIVNNVYNGNSMVYWGFTASTGGASNFHQFCIDVPDLLIDTSNLTVESEKCTQQNGSISGLNIIGGIAPFSWTWNNISSLNLDTFNLQSGTYYLEITDILGCTDNYSIVIEDYIGPIIDSSNIIIKNEDCGKGNGAISNFNIISESDNLLYFWNNISCDSIFLDSLSSYQYQFIVTDNFNCSDTMNILILDTNYHQISISYDSLIFYTDDTVLFYQNSLDSSYLNWWTFDDNTSSNIYEPFHIFNQPGIFTVCLEAANEFNCYDTSCIEIQILSPEIIVPNIFSPNSDDINDEFYIYGINNDFELKVFNRWGNFIFSEYPYNNTWNGQDKNGNQISEGQYFYILKSFEEDVEIKGKIVVVK